MRPPAKLALLVAVALLLAACGGGGEAPTADGATAEETVATSPSPADSPAEAATAGAARFRSKAAFARWNGTAPIPVRRRRLCGGDPRGERAFVTFPTCRPSLRTGQKSWQSTVIGPLPISIPTSFRATRS